MSVAAVSPTPPSTSSATAPVPTLLPRPGANASLAASTPSMAAHAMKGTRGKGFRDSLGEGMHEWWRQQRVHVNARVLGRPLAVPPESALPKPRPFILAPHRPRAATPRPPSPYRLRLVPEGREARTLDCPRTVTGLPGAKRHAATFASDVGVSGRVEVLEVVDGDWKPTCVLDVRNSAPAGWHPP